MYHAGTLPRFYAAYVWYLRILPGNGRREPQDRQI